MVRRMRIGVSALLGHHHGPLGLELDRLTRPERFPVALVLVARADADAALLVDPDLHRRRLHLETGLVREVLCDSGRTATGLAREEAKLDRRFDPGLLQRL